MKTGIIVNNVGTPENPSPQAVGQYLKEFLMDKEIIPLPWVLRYILVHFIIVPKRKYDSSKKYQSIWGKIKSPLLEYSESFLEKLQAQLGQQYIVKLGMCFGSPSIEQAVMDLVKAQVDKIVFVPMYPQKARATTVAATNLFRKYIKKHNFSGAIESFYPFYKEEAFVENSVRMLQADLALCKYDHVLFSFHGLPDTPIAQEYKEQCIATADFISRRAGLEKDRYSVSFQSRLGPKKWLTPYTSEVAVALAAQGCKRLLVQTPSFTVDCLETLEEISEELKEDFINAGGELFKQVPCLNDNKDWIRDFSSLLASGQLAKPITLELE